MKEIKVKALPGEQIAILAYEFDELTVHAWCDLEPYKG